MTRYGEYVLPDRLRMLLRSKPVRAGIAATVFLSFLLIAFWSPPSTAGLGDRVKNALGHSTTGPKGRLHLLVPATSSNTDLCKLMLSAQILGYPAPVLINFGAKEDKDAYVQHLAKVKTLMDYMDHIKSNSDYEEDLVLILDGYDMWLQLRPDVLIKRYFEINRKADERASRQFGEENAKQKDMRTTILFGPDKLCWPIDYNRPACWAVPETDLPPYSFGPETGGINDELAQPRWLNSGTIMGPIQDLKDLFEATQYELTTRYQTNSDQFYFAEIFGRQEYARLTHNPDLLERYKKTRHGREWADPSTKLERRIPDIDGIRTEFHIGLDYASTIFQTLAFWKQNLAWMRPIDSWTGGQELLTEANPYYFTIPEDMAQSAPPFEALGENTTWAELELHYNSVTREAPVALHFTGEKRMRETWWNHLWLKHRGRELREATVKRLASPEIKEVLISPKPIAGLTWVNAETEELREHRMAGESGADSDTVGWVNWNDLCFPYQDEIYDSIDETSEHPWVSIEPYATTKTSEEPVATPSPSPTSPSSTTEATTTSNPPAPPPQEG